MSLLTLVVLLAGSSPAALAAEVFPPGHEDATEWDAVVLHHAPAGEPTPGWSGPERSSCHFVVGNGQDELDDGGLRATAAWREGRRTAHLLRQNRVAASIAVCLEGDLDRRAPSTAQTEKVVALLRLLHERLGLEAQAVYTHRELDGRRARCPGWRLNKQALLEAAGLLSEDAPTRVVVSRKKRRLILTQGERAVWRFSVSALGGGRRRGLGPGTFRVCRRDRGTAFTRYLGLCPAGDDADDGRAAIHGGGDVLHYDWTVGCIGLEDRDAKALYEAVPEGVAVEVRP